MRSSRPLLVATLAIVLLLAACAPRGPADGASPAQQEKPERGSGRGGGGGGGMM